MGRYGQAGYPSQTAGDKDWFDEGWTSWHKAMMNGRRNIRLTTPPLSRRGSTQIPAHQKKKWPLNAAKYLI